jgi:ABC-type Fe3+-hydroxamate transport system substrate-binding protein
VRWLGSLLLALTLLTACGEERRSAPPRPTPTPTVSADVTAGTRTVVDMSGRLVRVPERVERVVVLSPSAREIAGALGVQIVGAPTDAPAPGAAPVGSALNPDFPAIAALQPDLVIADVSFHGSRGQDFDTFPYPVFVLGAATYNQILVAISRLGAAMNLADAAAAAVEQLTAEVDAILERVEALESARPAPRVLILTGGGRDVFVGGDETYLGSLVALLGGENVWAAAPEGGPLPGYGVVGVGESAATMPDVVLIIPSGEGGLPEVIAAEPSWAAVPALVNGRIHELDRELFLRAPGPRVVEALEILEELLWP